MARSSNRKKNTRKKKQANSSKNAQQAPSRRRSTRAGPSAYGLDARGLAYAKLLSDPCGAPLVHGVGVGASGGILLRFVSDFGTTIDTAGDTAGAVVFAPGLWLGTGTASATNPAAVAYRSDATGSAAGAWNFSLSQQPGYFALANGNGKHRNLAACMQVIYPGAESARSGIWSIGMMPVSKFGSFGSTTSVDQIMAGCQVVRRVDDKMLEMKWVPSSEDSDWIRGQRITVSEENQAESNCLVVAYSGLPANQTIQVRLTMVVEADNTFLNNTRSTSYSPPSTSTLNGVLNYLHSKEPAWFAKSASAIYGVGSALLSAI